MPLLKQEIKMTQSATRYDILLSYDMRRRSSATTDTLKVKISSYYIKKAELHAAVNSNPA